MRSQVLTLLLVITLLRFAGLICGLFYGPFFYAVLTLGGLYLTLDCVTAYLVYADDEEVDDGGYSYSRVFKIAWAAANVLGVVGLLAAIGLFVALVGFWGMTHEPIHIVLFVICVCLVVLILVAIGVIATLLKRGVSGRGGGRPLDTAYKGLDVYQ